MEHSKRLVCGAQMDVLTTQANSYFVGVQMSKVLQRETFNLYRSFKLKKIPFVRASTPEIEYLIEVGAVPGSTHSITLVPVDLAVPYIQEVLKQQETGKGLTGRKPKRLREQQNNMNHTSIAMRRDDSEEDLHDHDAMSPITEVKRMRRDGEFSSPSLSSQPSSPQATAVHPESPSSPFLASYSSSPSTSPHTASLFSTSSHSLFVPSFPLSTSLEASSSPALLSRGGTQSASRVPSTFPPHALPSSCAPLSIALPASPAPSDASSQSPPSSPTLLSLLSVGMEIDRARTRRRKPAPEAIYRSLKKEAFILQSSQYGHANEGMVDVKTL